MIVSDLKQHQQTSRRVSKRKHEGVRTPTARNAIIRDRETDAYVAHTDGGELNDSDNAIHLRLNALELNVSALMRGDAVAKGYAAPALQPAPATGGKSNVVPMDGARKAKEQSKVVQHSHPLPVAGNEAVVLPAPEPMVVEEVRPLKTANVEPTHIGKVTLVPSETVAANDSLIPDEVVATLKEITDESPEDMERLAEAYGMDIVEASQILYKEYAKREKHCYETHDKERADVQLTRLLSQRGIVECSGALNQACPVWVRSVDSNFAAFWNETEARMPHLRSLAEGRRVLETTTERSPLTKGEAAYRKKTYVNDLASRRPAKPGAIGKLESVHRKLHVAPGPTSSTQLAVVGTVAWSVYQKGRKLLGMQPTLRGAAKRAKYNTQDAITDPTSGDTVRAKTTAELFAACPPTLSQADVVRGYHRTGIGY